MPMMEIQQQQEQQQQQQQKSLCWTRSVSHVRLIIVYKTNNKNNADQKHVYSKVFSTLICTT